jgi:hypothetical protein
MRILWEARTTWYIVNIVYNGHVDVSRIGYRVVLSSKQESVMIVS